MPGPFLSTLCRLEKRRAGELHTGVRGWWWYRFQKVRQPLALSGYKALGVDYVVFKDQEKLKDITPVFENTGYVVYRPSSLHLMLRAFLEKILAAIAGVGDSRLIVSICMNPVHFSDRAFRSLQSLP